MRTTLLHDRAVELSKAKVHVSLIRCFVLAEFMKYPQSSKTWKGEIEWFTKFREYRELDCIYGEPVEFNWKHFPRTHNTVVALRDPKEDGGEYNSARTDRRSNYLHVDVQ